MDENQTGEGIGLDAATFETPNNLVTEPQPEGESLAELLGKNEQEPEKDSRPPNKEPGWVQKRIDGALQKKLPDLVAAAEARIRAEYDAKMKPLLEYQLTREADELVRDGEFKSKERALEYLRLKGGVPAPVTPVKAEVKAEPNEYEARADALLTQAQTAKLLYGIDPMEIYKSSPEVAQKVNSGEWDFDSIVQAVRLQAKSPTPSPVYSSNGASPQKQGIHELTPEAWQKLNENVRKGVKVRGD